MQMLMSLGLPFSSKDLSEIVNHYVIASTEKVNYQSFLKDTRLPQNGADEISNGKPINIRKYSSILSDIKKLLLETLEKLNKHPDDLYRTFARWDSLGTGTVTATQFLRVLSRMHVDLSDQDQDFLVELLDSNGEGRIDFESLLSFCFAGMNDDRGNGQNTWTSGSVSVDDNVIEILSAEGNTSELKSFASINRRPHTATVTRPFQSSANNQSNQIEESMMDKRQIYNGNKSPGKSIRPLTASARVSSPSTDVLSESKGPSLNVIDDAMYVRDMPDDVIDGEERYMDPVSSTIVRNPRHGIDGMIQNNKANAKANKIERVIDIGDTSINDTTLMTNDQDEYFFGTPKAIPSIGAREGHWNMNSVDGWTDASLSSYSAGHDMKTWASPNKAAAYNYTNQFYDSTEFGSPTATKNFYPGNNQPNFPPIVEQAEGNDLSVSSVVASSVQSEKERSVKEPFEHLHLLANQILSTMREMIIARYKRGRSLREIFQHFDRSRKGYFDAGDFVRATSDLRIETTDKVASIAINQIAIDDYDKVSFGEFKVYVMDTDHKLLVISVQEQLAQLLELQGRKYQSWMIEKFWEEENQLTGRGAAARNNGVVSAQAFITGIQKVGASLTSAEIGRLVDRFDVDGNGVISITRFIRMIQNSNAWHSTEKVLAYQDEATEEAIILRRAIADGSAAQLGYPDISEEIISMCEYLGIRVMTERSMIWIAVDALKAPLPVSWTAETDNTGRTYFHNIVTNQSKWEHPLDPHFRKLRDQCRERLD